MKKINKSTLQLLHLDIYFTNKLEQESCATANMTARCAFVVQY